MKQFVVSTGKWTDTHVLSGSPEDAAIYAIKLRSKDRKSFRVSPMVLVQVRGRIPHYFNTYFILKEAGMNWAANRMRRKIQRRHNVDVAEVKKETRTIDSRIFDMIVYGQTLNYDDPMPGTCRETLEQIYRELDAMGGYDGWIADPVVGMTLSRS